MTDRPKSMASNHETEAGHMTVQANGHLLEGEKVKGRWQFKCESWPDLAKKHKGAESSAEIVAEFLAMAFWATLTKEQS